MTAKRKNAIFLTVVFLLSIWLPLVFADKQGGRVSVTENRTLAQFPNLTSMKGLRSGLENWINDNEGFRVQLQKFYADLSFNIFHTSPSDRVKFGKDGWYFYTGDNNLQIASGTYPMTQETLEKIKDTQVAIQQALKKKGITYILVFTPSKVSVYPENLIGNFQECRTVIDEVADYLTENTTIPVINVKSDLLKAKQTQVIYHKTDTHWNQAGAYVGYSTIINRLNNLGLIDTKPANITTFPSTYKGEFSAMMGDIDLLQPEPIEATKIISPKAQSLESSELYDKIQLLKTNDGIYTSAYLYKNPSINNKKMLIYGDAFFASWNIPQLFAENFSDLSFIWSDYITNDIVDELKPDFVILERTERYLFTLANGPDPAFLCEPLKNPQAQIVSTTTPTQVERGKNII